MVLASPGFMDNGSSRELLELWAPDARNAVIITGYSVEGTMARVSSFFDVSSTFSYPYRIFKIVPKRLSV